MNAEGRDFIIAKRQGSWVYDSDNKRYLDGDTGGGIFNLGHRHPDIITELRRAVKETDQGNFPMISIEKAALAKSLAGFVGHDLECAVFGVMRGESVEFACKVARGFTGATQLVTVSGGWYGETGFAMSLSERPDKDQYGPLIPDTRTIAFGDLDAANEVICKETAAVILEPIQAENHCQTATADYVQGLKELCIKHNALLVFDETQTGFGRSGEKFVFMNLGVTPDILILGEALGGGIFPICAGFISQRVNSYLNDHPLIHLSTFGGSDVGCRVAKKTLEIYEKEKPWKNAAEIGGELIKKLNGLQKEYPQKILSVEGCGLLLSLEMDSDETALAFCKIAAGNGLLVAPGRVCNRSVVFRPGLLLTADEAGILVKCVEDTLKKL